MIPEITLHEEIGRGADSVVYRATRRGQQYAVKVQRSEHQGDEQSRRFAREAGALARIVHPSLATIQEIGRLDGLSYIVMEYIDGETLADLLSDGSLPEARTIQIGRSIAGALAAVHRNGLVHRDVKPQNILVSRDGSSKLIDFGFASSIDDRAKETAVVGTLSYCAPEQAGVLKRAVDGRSDLYALGVVLFEAATGRLPFVTDNAAELLRQHAAVEAPSARGLAPKTSENLDRIIAKLLAKDPDDRYQSAEALADDLDGILTLTELDAKQSSRSVQYDSPMVGRADELKRLDEAWERAAGGEGGIVVISGDPGGGKSRLARELVRHVRERDVLVLSGKCTIGGVLPFEALRNAVDDWLRASAKAPAAEQEALAISIRTAAKESAPLLKHFSQRLAAVLSDSPTLPSTAGVDDQLFDALADFLIALAKTGEGVLLAIDDIQWLDDASVHVLERLAMRVGNASFLIACTARSDPASSASTKRFVDQIGSALSAEIQLAGLSRDGLEQLISGYLGSSAYDAALVDKIASVSGGNAFAAGEYLRGMIDASLLRPCWGRWELTDRTLSNRTLEELELPTDLLQLIAQRISRLGGATQRVLATAAVAGSSFDAGLLERVSSDPAGVRDALSEAAEARLIESAGADRFRFVHDRLREATLVDLEPAARVLIHRSLAQALDGEDCSGEDIYAVARHYHLAGPENDPPRTFDTCARAGYAASGSFAFDRAHEFFQQASAAAVLGAIEPGADFAEAAGDACAHTGRIDEAVAHFHEALVGTTDPIRRCYLHYAISKTHIARHDMRTAREHNVLAFRALGRKAPKNTVLDLLISLLAWIFGWVLRRIPATYGTARGRERNRHSAQVALYRQFVYTSYFEMDSLAMVQGTLRTYLHAVRLGPSTHYVELLSTASAMLGILRLERYAERAADQALAMAHRLGDPIVLARAEFARALMKHFLGKAAEAVEVMSLCIERSGRWLDNSDYFTGCGDLAWNLTMRGHAKLAYSFIERADARAALDRAGAEFAKGHSYRCCEGPALAMLGRGHEGRIKLDEYSLLADAASASPWRVAAYLAHRALFYVELGELGAPLEAVIQRVQALKLNPARAPLTLTHFYVAQATARLLQWEAAEGDARVELKPPVDFALGQLRAASGHPTIQAHYLVLEGWRARVAGRAADAHQLIGRAEIAALTGGNRWVLFEVYRQRAGLLAQAGQQAASKQIAEQAYQLALAEGWLARVRAVRAEFYLERASVASRSNETTRSDVQTVQLSNFLESLIEVSLVSATSLDPAAQARAALDTLVRVLNAERAFLFLMGEDQQLVHTAGRDAEGRDLPALSGYSMTVVDRVYATGEAIVVSGNDESEIMVAESVVAQDLRSIMAAPLAFRDRLVGIVYLDSRLARGLFTWEDVGILRGIGNHIAFAIEISRSAQLEAAVESERAQRVLAETMRSVSATLNSTLDLDTVLARLLESLAEVVPYDRALVMLQEPDGFRVVAARAHESGMVGRLLDLPSHPGLSRIIERDATYVSGGGAHYLGHDGVRSWIGVPLVVREQVVGILTIDSFEGNRYDGAQASIVVMFAEQGATAVENARLFGEVQRQAITDPLTGAFNRGQLFIVGEQMFKRAQRSREPISVLLLDFDHFKRINDTHGHSVGDRVLIESIDAMQDCVRSSDILGRYGGEEFAVILAEADGPGAQIVAGRVLAAIRGVSIPGEFGPVPVTASIGVATLIPNSSSDLSKLFARADKALYLAKHDGRDRAVFALDEVTCETRAPVVA